MSLSRLFDLVLFGLLAIMVVWHGHDFFVAARGVEYFTEKPIRLVYVTGLAVWIGTCLAFFVSRPKRDKWKGGPQ